MNKPLLSGFVLIILLLGGCRAEEPQLSVQCCQQCLTAASQDPAGMDISGKDCRGYDEKLSKGCRGYFEEELRTVEECRLVEK